MYNLLVSFSEDSWNEGIYEFPRDRIAVEYTEDSISERYKGLEPKILDELKNIPSLFCVEHEKVMSKVGYITSIKVKTDVVRIEFEFDDRVPALKRGFLENSSIHFELGRFELARTHWAIKSGNLLSILTKKKIKLSQSVLFPVKAKQKHHAEISPGTKNQKVFVVHGHDEVAKYEMAEAIRSLGAEPIILHEQASEGLTIIEKIERHTDVAFGVVLYTPCDLGGKKASEISLHPRARQNVVFEHGYLIGKLERKHVMAFVKGKMETPTDISGVVYVELDQAGNWKDQLAKELKAAGYKVIFQKEPISLTHA